jgi:hypothetical protein
VSNQAVNTILIQDYSKPSNREKTHDTVLAASRQSDLAKFTRAVVM